MLMVTHSALSTQKYPSCPSHPKSVGRNTLDTRCSWKHKMRGWKNEYLPMRVVLTNLLHPFATMTSSQTWHGWTFRLLNDTQERVTAHWHWPQGQQPYSPPHQQPVVSGTKPYFLCFPGEFSRIIITSVSFLTHTSVLRKKASFEHGAFQKGFGSLKETRNPNLVCRFSMRFAYCMFLIQYLLKQCFNLFQQRLDFFLSWIPWIEAPWRSWCEGDVPGERQRPSQQWRTSQGPRGSSVVFP